MDCVTGIVAMAQCTNFKVGLRGLRYVDCGDAVVHIAMAQTERFYATPKLRFPTCFTFSEKVVWGMGGWTDGQT